MDLDGLAFHQDRLGGLNTQTMEGRRPIEKNRVLLDDVLEDVPNFRAFLFNKLFSGLDGRRNAALFELPQDERLEELEGHFLRQAALVQLEVRADHDDGATGIVDPFPEEILTEPPPLPFEGF